MLGGSLMSSDFPKAANAFPASPGSPNIINADWLAIWNLERDTCCLTASENPRNIILATNRQRSTTTTSERATQERSLGEYTNGSRH